MKPQLYNSKSSEDTYRLAEQLAEEMLPGTVLALHGDLGAGKTCFVQGLAVALGVEDIVNSPTYTLINEYAGRLPLYHLDLYRLSHPEEALDIGLDEYMYGSGVTAIEWPERVEGLLPKTAWRIEIESGSEMNDRAITIYRGEQP